MSNQKHEELDMNELTELTPFGLDVYNTRGNLPSSKVSGLDKVLESAKPLQPSDSKGDKA